jgi:nucleotide-binding universal stress UspA family protein
MTATTPILIAYDGSPASQRAVRHAASLMPGHRALVVTARTAQESIAARIDGHDASAHEPDDATERIAGEGVLLARAAGLDAEALIAGGDGPVAHTIIDAAERAGAGLIVLGSRGRHTLRSLALGSVSRHIVQDGRIATLVVPPPRPRIAGEHSPHPTAATAVEHV